MKVLSRKKAVTKAGLICGWLVSRKVQRTMCLLRAYQVKKLKLEY